MSSILPLSPDEVTLNRLLRRMLAQADDLQSPRGWVAWLCLPRRGSQGMSMVSTGRLDALRRPIGVSARRSLSGSMPRACAAD